MSEKQTVKFGDICREVKLTTKDPIADGYDRYIGLEHLDSGSLKIKRWGMIAEDNPSFTRVFKKGHILFGKRRPYLKKAAIAEFDGICSGDIIVMEPSDSEVPRELLPFIVQSEGFWAWAVKTSSGSLSPRTKFKNLCEYLLPKESKEKYQSKLSVLTEGEALKVKADIAIDAFSNMARLLIDNSFDAIQSHSTIDSLIESGDILEVQDGNHGNDHPKASEYVESGIPFVMASDLSNGRVDLHGCKRLPKSRTDKLRIGFSKSGDVLLSHKGTVGLVARTPNVAEYIMLTPQVTYYRVNDSGQLSSRYLEVYFRSSKFQKNLASLAAQSTRAYIGITAQKKLLIPIPNTDQKQQVEALWENLESTRTALENSRDKLASMTNNIING
ncbi:Type I restriction modification DNA specificity domain [Providencia rustigianii]|uniref:Type I restriction modification DNA specificity domain n=1 Tax=Providencia rustigianii TaxID=158850 RepID=A0A379G912_9GAMM|nr:restriction endonuclease subunit S [Providencia rustigianii]SUC37362.1 Type I restriction modification DNA specificity domain [Providencia rustigianii]